MAVHPVLRQLNADSKDLDAHNDTRGFLDDVVAPSPSAHVVVGTAIDTAKGGSQPAEHAWSKEDAQQEGNRRFRQVKAVADEVLEEGVCDQEGGEDDVGDMWRRGLDLGPDHCCSSPGGEVSCVVS